MDGGYLSDNWCKSYGIIEIENVVSVWYSFKLGSVELVPGATWMKKRYFVNMIKSNWIDGNQRGQEKVTLVKRRMHSSRQ